MTHGPATDPAALVERLISPNGADHARITRWTAAELLAIELPDPRWAVPELVPEGLVVLAGRPKKGKSRLALSMSISVASGIPALGYFDVLEAGPVLFVGLEDGPRRLQERMQDMIGTRPPPPNLDLWIDLPKLGEGCVEELELWLKRHDGARMIVLDTYQRLRKPPTGRDSNSYMVDYGEAADLQKLAMRYGVAIILICHTRKPVGGTDPFDDVMGSTGNTAAADAIMVLQTELGRADAKLFVTGRDVEQAEHALSNHPQTGQWFRIGDAQDIRRSAQREAILTALRVAGGDGMKPHEIAVATKMKSNNVRFLLFRMKHEGEVAETSGKYRIAVSGVSGVSAYMERPALVPLHTPANALTPGQETAPLSEKSPLAGPVSGLPRANGAPPPLSYLDANDRGISVDSHASPVSGVSGGVKGVTWLECHGCGRARGQGGTPCPSCGETAVVVRFGV